MCQAFLEQFQRDFSAFLSLRSEEIVSGGRMFLTFLGRSIADPSSKDCCCLLELLTKSLIQLVNEVYKLIFHHLKSFLLCMDC